MTATIDGVTRERLLEFANGRDGGEREALIDLAGKWKHNWIPLDAIAAAIKAKKMKGDGIRRSNIDTGEAKVGGKSRLDPHGAVNRASITSGARGKGKIPKRAAAPPAVASSAPPAEQAARHAQIRQQIKVRKENKGGNVSFVASHDNGQNVVSARIPQQRGRTDHEHRLAARDALHKGIVRDHPNRQPAAAGNTQADRDKALNAQRDAEASAAISTLGSREAHDLQRMAASDNVQPRVQKAAKAELDRRAAARAAGLPKHGLADYGTRYDNPTRLEASKRNLKETHPVGMQVDARQPGIDRVTPGIVTAHKPDGMVEVGYRDHRGDIARGTFNPAHVTPSHRAETVDVGTAGASSGIGALNADLPKGYRITRDARMGPALEHNGKIIRTGSVGHEQNLVQYAKDHATGDVSAHPKSWNDMERERKAAAAAGKAPAAAEPAAPEVPAPAAKKPRKPSALHQEYRARREEQDRRFEAHAGGGVAAQDTHTQEYKDYFGVGDHSTTPQEQRLTFKSFLEERRQGKEHERRQQQAYDSGMALGNAHGQQDDSSKHEDEYRHHEAGHDSEMFGQGYSDGIIAGSAKADAARAEAEKAQAGEAHARAKMAASTASNAAVRSRLAPDHISAVHAHVAAARAALAAGKRDDAQHHIKMAEMHKATANTITERQKVSRAADALEQARSFGQAANAGERANIGQAQAEARRAAQGPPKQGEMFGGHGEHQGDMFDQPAEASPTAAAKPDASRHAGITVEHSGDGTVVHGTERGDTETTSALKAQGFKWSRNLNGWYLPRTWNESTREMRVRGLEARLGDKITVQRGDLAKSTGGAEERTQRIARANELAQRHTERAGKLDAEASSRFDAAHKATEGIPFGQPILVGHHSQRRHENALAKSHANMRAGVDAHQAAEDARSRAGSAAARARLEEDPKFLARRLDRNQAEHRKVLRTLSRADPADEHTQRLHAIRRDLEGKISADQAAMSTAGGGQHSKHTITPGDVITYRGDAHVVHKTNAKTVTVPHWEPRLAAAGHTDTIPYSQIEKHGRLEDAKPETLRKMLERPNLPDPVKSRIRALLRDKEAPQ